MIQRSGVTTRREIGRVVRTDEGEGLRTGGLRQDFADGGAVAEHDDAPARVRGGDALDGTAQATAEDLAGLGAGDHVPSLLGQHLREDRVTVG